MLERVDAYVDEDIALYRGGLDWIVDFQIILQSSNQLGFLEKILFLLSTGLMLGMLSRGVRVSESLGIRKKTCNLQTLTNHVIFLLLLGFDN